MRNLCGIAYDIDNTHRHMSNVPLSQTRFVRFPVGLKTVQYSDAYMATLLKRAKEPRKRAMIDIVASSCG